MKLEEVTPELAYKLEVEYLENLLAKGIETLNKEQLAISNGLHAIYTLEYVNNRIVNYLKRNVSDINISLSLDSLYIVKNQSLKILEEAEPYLSNYLANL